MKKEKYNKAFTLIELLLVVAILTILVSMAVPYFVRYRNNGASTTAELILRNCMTSLSISFHENNTTSLNCSVGNNIITLYINSQGEISIIGNTTTLTIHGVTLNCTIENNTAICEPIA